MKIVKLTIILIVIISSSAFSQSITLFDVDASEFPLLRAKFYAFDEAGNQQRPGINQLSITENGVERTITNVICPPVEPPRAVSSVLTISSNCSMLLEQRIDIVKESAIKWFDLFNFTPNKCAITSFHGTHFLHQDFTNDKDKLTHALSTLWFSCGSNYNRALLEPMAGALILTNNEKSNKVIIVISAVAPSNDFKTFTVVNEAKRQGGKIYFIYLDKIIPDALKIVANLTNGGWYENIATSKQLDQVLYEIHSKEFNIHPCTIEWESEYPCIAEEITVEIDLNNTRNSNSYIINSNLESKLDFEPTRAYFKEPEIGEIHSQIVKVTARNYNFVISDIVVSNTKFDINPRSFSLNVGESIELTVTYEPTDSVYQSCTFEFVNDKCKTQYISIGGYPGVNPIVKTIKLTHPNGGEVFVAGSYIDITWEGIPVDETVVLEYRTGDEQEWERITNDGTGLSHRFKVPSIESDKYLAKVTAKSEYEFKCIGDEVFIGEQTWMCRNLDVAHYRNGEPIVHARNSQEWVAACNAKTGAWCYYDFDPANGEIYGKLYNLYAIFDKRGIAPVDWRMSTEDDWVKLIDYLGENAYYKLAGNYILWDDGDLRNHPDFSKSGFNGLPAGQITGSSSFNFDLLNKNSTWWTNTINKNPDIPDAISYLSILTLSYDGTGSIRGISYSNYSGVPAGAKWGYSVRCIRK